MSLKEPSDRRSGRRSRDPSPADYSRYEDPRYYDERDHDDGRRKEYEYARDSRDEPRYARPSAPADKGPPYGGKKTASFAMPGAFEPEDDRPVKKYEVKKEDPMAYGDKRGSKYDDKKFAEPSKKYYDDEPPRRESNKYYEDEPAPKSKYEREPEMERSRERASKQYYDDNRNYDQEPGKSQSKQYYDDEYTRKETRYEVSKPASKSESSPKPKYATPVYAAPSIAAATAGSAITGANPKYYDSDSESSSEESDGPTGERRLDVEIDFKHHDKSDVTVRKRPDRKKKYHFDEHSSALVTTTTTTQGARLEGQYATQPRYSYAPPVEKISYSDRPLSHDYGRYESQRPTYISGRTSETKITTVSTSSGKKQEAAVVTAEPGHRQRASMGATLGATLGAAGGLAAGSLNAPGSPMLEAYRGTYQSMGSMPSPLMMPSAGFSSSQDVAILDLNRTPSPSARGRHARFHDLKDDAEVLKVALRDNGKKKPPPSEPFIRILPPLSHGQIMDLRTEYKLQVKTPDHKGVNVAKHIKVRLKEDKSFLKCCYATALGKWESEGYWANSYYQGSQTSRELLIESLMGKSNAEIREIKAVFRDKKYSDDLVKCMKRELKEDKFKTAIMLVLDERKMEEPTRMRPLDRRAVERDVRDLYHAIRSERGGETDMIQIVVRGSEAHMREVLRVYENTYHANFAREMLKKSGNLVVSLSYPYPSITTWY